MRQPADATRVRKFMAELGRAARSAGRAYLTGGASAVLVGWRRTTIDVDLKLVPESDDLLRSLPGLKESLSLNVELAAPDQFLPALAGWADRSVFIEQQGPLAFYHYDFSAQALAKIERGHRQDLEDARAMLGRGFVDRAALRGHFAEMEPFLFRYPAVNPLGFRRALDDFLSEA